MTRTWIDFWNGAHSLYVSERHLQLHATQVAKAVLKLPEAMPGATLFDYGCGDALAAQYLIDAGISVVLFDAAYNVSERNRARYHGSSMVRIVTKSDFPVLRQRCDALIVNSVLQYMPKHELADLLNIARHCLRPNGSLYLGDLIPSGGLTIFADAYFLLKSSWRGRFVGSALIGLAKTFFSDYNLLKRERGFSCWSEAELSFELHQRGWSSYRMPHNLGTSEYRYLIRAKRKEIAQDFVV